MILGIDEVGRGPWAGPLVVGAVVLGGAQIEGLTDSKKLSKKRREDLDLLIRSQASGFGLGWVFPEEIDEVGLSQSLVLATKRAVEQIKTSYSEIIIDGTVNFLKETTKGKYVTTLKKADLLIPSVSAASIIAKVARDNYMYEQDSIFPEYGFKDHVGYGTSKHIQAIKESGVTPIHRLSIKPLINYSKEKTKKITDMSKSITTKDIGDNGEDAVVNFLVGDGHEIIARNWKTKLCEIDIISVKERTMYFTEVKYRKNANQGGGIPAITPAKLKKMKFVVEIYSVKNDISKYKKILQGVSVIGSPARIDDVLEVV